MKASGWLYCAAATFLAALLVVVCGAAWNRARAAGEEYPHRPVRILVPYGPGGVGDLTIRLIADRLSQNLKQPFIIENRPGAGGIAAMRAVLGAPADGYTLAEMGNGQSISMGLFQNLPYDVLNDFAQISLAARYTMLLATPPMSPFRSVKDVIAAAQRAPGKLNLGAINPGSTQNLSAHLFQQVSGAQFTIVTYRTTPDLVTALLRSEVDLGFDYYPGFESTIGPDKLHIIATSGETRDPLLGDVPTAAESGLPGYAVTGWNGIAAPAGVPAPIIATLSAEIRRALADPGVQDRMRRIGLDAQGSTPQEMHDQMAREIAKWRAVIAKAGIPRH
jgi:tripartite-type tricarboxylate transporter receptor subunit TctC